MSCYDSPPRRPITQADSIETYSVSPHSVASITDKMMSTNSAVPLSGHARMEYIRQMTASHDAFKKASEMHVSLAKVQTTLRHLPGIPAEEGEEMTKELQEVARSITRETGHLVDALVNISLDHEDAQKALSRISLEANKAGTELDTQHQITTDQGREIQELHNITATDKEEMRKMIDDFRQLSTAYKELQKSKEEIYTEVLEKCREIEALQKKVSHLEEQLDSRRSLWAMENTETPAVKRAVGTIADSVQDKAKMHKILDSLKAFDLQPQARENGANGSTDDNKDNKPATDGAAQLGGPLPNLNRGPPPSMPLPFQSGVPVAVQAQHAPPSRAPSVMPSHRNPMWNNNNGVQGNNFQHHHGLNGGMTPFLGEAFNPGPSRNSWSQNLVNRTHRGMSNSGPIDQQAPDLSRPQSSYSSRPPSAFGQAHGREVVPRTPNRNGRHSRYGSSAEVTTPSRNGHHNAFNGHGFGNGFINFNGPPQGYGYGNGTAGIPNPLNGGNPNSAVYHAVVRLSEQGISTWSKRITDFYNSIRTFVMKHANLPDDNISSEKLRNTNLWEVLIGTYKPLSLTEALSYLDHHLRAENSKCCLVTRVIIDYIVTRVWSSLGWMNIDDEATISLAELDREINRSNGQASHIRQPLVDQQAAVVESLIRRGAPMNKQKTAEIAGTLLNYLQPLINKASVRGDVYRDLEAVAGHAWNLSAQILTSRLSFDFRFPEIGTRFSSQAMLPIWPNMDPVELQARHWRVAQVVTPVVTVRNDMGSRVSAHSVTNADVVCMQ